MASSLSPAPNKRNRQHGFTLMEVMVALAVIGIALAAIIKSASESGGNLNYLRDRSYAQWVATDRLTELQATEAWGTGRERGEREMAGRVWHWQTEIQNSAFANLRQVTVRVYAQRNDDAPIATLDGLLANPELRAAAQQQGGGS